MIGFGTWRLARERAQPGVPPFFAENGLPLRKQKRPLLLKLPNPRPKIFSLLGRSLFTLSKLRKSAAGRVAPSYPFFFAPSSLLPSKKKRHFVRHRGLNRALRAVLFPRGLYPVLAIGAITPGELRSPPICPRRASGVPGDPPAPRFSAFS